jgi:hypothetical protein
MMGYKGGEPITGHHQLGTPPLMELDTEMDMDMETDMDKNMRPERPSNGNVPNHQMHGGSN